MSVHIVDDTIRPDIFNQKANHPLQSYEWGEARKKTGLNILRFETGSDVFTMTIHPIPYVPFKIGYIPRSVMPSDELLTYLQDWSRENNIIFIKFEPYVEKSTTYPLSTTRYLTTSSHPLFPRWTQMIDLDKTEDELLANLKQKTRYNVRLAEKKGVIVREESTDDGYETFSKLYFDTCARQKYYGHSREYHHIIWDTLKESIAKVLIAYYENEPLAAYELFYFKDTLYYPYGGSSEKHRNVMSANLLMWQAILLGKKLGAKTFDLWGSLPPNFEQDNKWGGFTRFKEGYGTRYVEFISSYDLVINPIHYKVYNAANHIRNYFLSQ